MPLKDVNFGYFDHGTSQLYFIDIIVIITLKLSFASYSVTAMISYSYCRTYLIAFNCSGITCSYMHKKRHTMAQLIDIINIVTPFKWN